MAESKSEDQKPEEDRISNLPDILLIHILSFLSSKTSVQTSILSPKWRNMWKHLSVLNLSDDDFVQFKENSQQIKDYLCDLNLSDSYFEFHDNFIHLNAELFKEDFSVLKLSDDDFIKFNDKFIQFISERFRHFRRFFYFVNSVIYVLRLSQVQKIRLSCTKSLTMNPMCNASVNLWIHYAMGPLIKELDITLYTIQNFWFYVPTNNISKCSNLVSLSLKGALRLTRNLPKSFSLPSLKTLGLDICGIGAASLNAFLQGCPCLETLDFYLYVKNYGTSCVPPLCLPSSLKSLKIVLRKHPSLNFYATEGKVIDLPFPKFDNLLRLNLEFLRLNSNFIMSLLQECHLLEVLIIQNDKEVCNDKEEQSSLPIWAAQSFVPSCVPSCLESHLRFIQFKGYRGFTEEYYFVEYILQKGRVLKTMIIVDILADLKEKLGNLKKLSNIPRASRMCQLIFD